MKRSLALFFAAMTLMLPLTARAAITVNLHNETGHWIYLDTHVFLGGVNHEGLIAPGATKHVQRSSRMKGFSADFYVYVKSRESEQASDTICSTMKSLRDMGGATANLIVHLHDNKCWISKE